MRVATLDDYTTIALAVEDDAAGIAELLTAAFVEFAPRYTPEALRATNPPPDEIARRIREDGPVWIAFDIDAPVGTVSVVARGEDAWIRSMAVLQSARGSGIGRMLLAHAEEFARSAGCGTMSLSTTPFLERAIRLYESAGFVRTEDPPHDLFGTPLFTMRKILRERRTSPPAFAL